MICIQLKKKGQQMAENYKIDRNLQIPLYHQIYQNILEMIEDGHLSPGEMLQPESDLTKLYGVSRLTLRQAFDQLERKGYITRRHGVGTFIANPATTQLVQGRISFTQKMQQIGKAPSSKLLSLQTVPAPEDVARNLHLELHTPVIELSRIRYADSEPIMQETAYLPAEQFPDLNQANLSESSLYAFLEMKYRITIKAVEQTLQPILLTQRQASLLDVTPDTPAMLTRLVAYTQNNTPIEYSISITRGDKCHFYFRFREEPYS
jgi:GntR family transcriptional regulator